MIKSFSLAGIFLLLFICKCPAPDFYVTCLNNNNVMEVGSSGDVSTFLTDIPGATGIAMDKQGNVYVASSFDNDIIKVTPTGVRTVFATGLDVPYGMAFDSHGNLFVANNGDSTIVKVSPDGTLNTFATLAINPANVVFDGNGDLYTENSPTTIVRFTPDGNMSAFAEGLTYPIGLTFDPSGDLYVSNGGDASTISRVSPDGTVHDFVTTGLFEPYGILWGSDGYLYSPNLDNTLSKISPEGVITPVVANQSLLGTPVFMVEVPEPHLLLYLCCLLPLIRWRLRSIRQTSRKRPRKQFWSRQNCFAPSGRN